MKKKMFRILLSAVLVSSLISGYGLTSASSSNSTQNLMFDSSWLSKAVAEEVPVAIAGVVKGNVALQKENFLVYVNPRDEIRAKLEVGDKVPIFQLSSDVVRTSGNQFSVHIDPNSLPDDYINDDGRVDIGVNVILPNEELMGVTHETVRLIENSNKTSLSWIDPLIDVETFDEVKSYLVTKEEIPELVKTNVELFDAPSVSELAESVLAHSENQSIVPMAKTKLGESKVWATVGYSLPVSGNPGNFVYEGGHSTKYGAGVKHTTSWSAGGTYTRSAAFEIEWDPSDSQQRAHNVEVRYYKYANNVGTTYYETFEPDIETGGNQEVTVTRPNYTHCVPTSIGTFKRSSSSGNSFYLSSGVKTFGAIGIDLSVESSYGNRRMIVYKVNQSGRQLCGNDEVPVKASIVMLK